eukprot:TRINITY_DN19603_c0_g1_i1.p1 TRINITY_DN19603_c0_g1~~TRINITY_DN19603_c0_g1_i1.p1  ORF type:complete len:1796 (+),score=377.18 TRINITY_DN19603_c0_g1_i1:38-5425(+)
MSSSSGTPRSPRGEAVYFHTEDESWVLGRRGIDGNIRAENGKSWGKIKDANCYSIMDEKGIDAETDDLLKLSELHEGALLRCVRKRHQKDQIYTFIGPSVVLSLNPWKYTIPEYTIDKIPLYIKGQPDLPPHIWSIGKNAYEAMLSNQQNQTVLVSGESGAGKTEAVKSLLKYLSEAAGGPSSDEHGLQGKIEACNPILETFGNAKTVRNDNSSRFGKFLKVLYNEDGHIIGAHTTSYLLERSRVIGAGKQERIFHSFYQLLASDDAKSAFDLDAPLSYPSCGKVINIEGVNDKECFKETCEAMETMGMTADEIKTTWSLVAGILHMQRVEFTMDPETDETVMSASSEEFLEKSAKMWRVSVSDLRRELTTLTTKAGNETVVRKHSVGKATATRDAICKEIYASLFKWLIFKINETMKPAVQDSSWIGLLDIFGFEHFQVNSLEQLCINLANEMLQNHYNEHIFTADIAECMAEGIETQHVEFQDNTAVVALIADSSNGILAHLDDQCKTRAEDDASFLDNITSSFSEDPAFHRTRLDRDAFRLRHYAAEVQYCVTNFGEKNLDSVQDGIIEVVRSSSDPLVACLIGTDPAVGTVTSIFKKQLKDLLSMINGTKPSWIRCIKPHPVKRPGLFDPNTTMAQLASSGVLETVRVRKLGYPVRLTHQLFVDRFKLLLPNALRKAAPIIAAASLLERLNLSKEKAQIGTSKVFLRSFAHTEMEERRTGARELFVNSVRKWAVTANAMRDAYARRYKGLLELLKKQREEREAMLADCNEATNAIIEEEASQRAVLSADILPSMIEACMVQCDRQHSEILDEEAEGYNSLLDHGTMLRKMQDEDQLQLVERSYDTEQCFTAFDENETWERLMHAQTEDFITVTTHFSERVRLDELRNAGQCSMLEGTETADRVVYDCEADWEHEHLLILHEEQIGFMTELQAEQDAIDEQILDGKLETVILHEQRVRETIEAVEESDLATLELQAEESAGTAEILAFQRWVHRKAFAITEEECRGMISDEEEGYFQVLLESEVHAYSRALALEHNRVQNVFQSDEHISRARIEEEYERSLPTLYLHKTVVKVKLYGQYLNEWEMQEVDKRKEIVRQYEAFCDTVQIAWTTNYYQTMILEKESICLQSRAALEVLHDESREQLLTLFMKGSSQVAAVERHNELQSILANLDTVQTTLQTQSPPRYASISPAVLPPAMPPQHTLTQRPRRTVSRSPSPNKQLQLPAPPPPDPFTSGTWLWRASVPSVARTWKRVFVKLIDGALHWCFSESSEAKIFKLSRVVSIDQHDLPDRDGYRAPDASYPTVAQRYSSTCQHSALRLGLKTEVGGSSSSRTKSILLCAEFPSVAVMWLRKLRQEWSKVCKSELHPHGSPGRTCTPGSHGTINISSLLSSPDEQAVDLVRDLRKWMRKAKQAGFTIEANADLRAFTDKPEGSVSPSHCKSSVCGFSRKAIARQCEAGHNVLTPPLHMQWDDRKELHDGDSDLSEDVRVDDLLEDQKRNMLAEMRPTQEYTTGKRQEDEWREAWKKAFGFKERVSRTSLQNQCRKGGALMRQLAKTTVYSTAATEVIAEVLMRRVFLEEGTSDIEREEFVTWCTGGGEDIMPCYVAMVRELGSVAALATSLAILASCTAPPQSRQEAVDRTRLRPFPSPVPKTPEEIDASSPVSLPSKIDDFFVSPQRSEISTTATPQPAAVSTPPLQQHQRPPPATVSPQLAPLPVVKVEPVITPPQVPPPSVEPPQKQEPENEKIEKVEKVDPVPPPQEPAPSPDGWECSACLEANPEESSICFNCETPR